MANIKGLGDFKDKDSDSEGGDHNDYYAGGEKRCADLGRGPRVACRPGPASPRQRPLPAHPAAAS